MKYQFKTGIDVNEYDAFVRSFPSTSFMQTPAWSLVKTAWEHDYVGLYEKDKLICGAMVLKRNLFLGKKLFYIPRGFVVNYNDKNRYFQQHCRFFYDKIFFCKQEKRLFSTF